MGYIAAKLARAEGDVHVALHVKQTGTGKADHHAYLVVLEAKPMQQGMVSVDAAVLAHDITASGHIAVSGSGPARHHGRLLRGTSVLSPHDTVTLVVKLVLDFRIAHRPVDGLKIAGSVLRRHRSQPAPGCRC